MPLLVLLVVSVAAGVLAYWAWRWLPGRVDVPHAGTSMAARAAALTPVMVLLALSAVVIGSLALVVEQHTPLRRWDDRVERWAVGEAGPLTTDLLRAVTHLGDTITVVSVTVTVVLFLVAVARRPRWALFLAVVVVGQWALANALKWAVGRPRPELDPLSTFSGQSFPSGHTTAAAATYLALALVASAVIGRADRRLLVSVAVGVAVAVGGSRVLLGVHWFTDVVAGLLLGSSWCLVCLVVLDPDGPSRVRLPRPPRRPVRRDTHS